MTSFTVACLSASAAALIATAAAPAAEPVNPATGRPQLAPEEIPAGAVTVGTGPGGPGSEPITLPPVAAPTGAGVP